MSLIQDYLGDFLTDVFVGLSLDLGMAAFAAELQEKWALS